MVSTGIVVSIIVWVAGTVVEQAAVVKMVVMEVVEYFEKFTFPEGKFIPQNV